MAEKHAAVTMIACVFGAFDSKPDIKIRQLQSLDQCDIKGAAVLRLVIAFACVEAKDLIFICFLQPPRGLIRCFPIV